MQKHIFTLALFSLLLCTGLQSQQLVSSTFKGSRTKAQLQAQFGVFMQNGITMHKIQYTTLDVFGQLDTASGLLVLPVRDGDFAYPLLAFMHGTVNSPTDVPSNLAGGWELAAVFGGMGYVSAAPDFLGLGDARGFHPYVHAATEASAGKDMLLAVKEYALANDVYLNDQLFVTGYSQGGHAAAALHRLLEQEYADELPVTASAPMSGPYSISGEMKELILSYEPYGTVAYLPYTALSYDMVYGLFDNEEEYFKPAYASAIQQFRNGQITLGTLNIQLITQLIINNGASITRYMLQDSIIAAVEADPMHPVNLALADNDLTNWAPQAPTRLFYCEADDQVPYTNAIVADSSMNALGAVDLEAISVNMNADHGECVEPATFQTVLFFGQFQQILVGATEEVVESPVVVFPNPAKDQFYLGNVPAGATVVVTDLSGRIVQRHVYSDPASPVVLSNQADGMYWVHAYWENGSWTGKLALRND
ncbi:MAG: T9SS type A sorting domain-containing protein [Saprospiraceae bacterium]|nr:T9SS type A sorting domain-containing protein [Saprospiraceae bacterium]